MKIKDIDGKQEAIKEFDKIAGKEDKKESSKKENKNEEFVARESEVIAIGPKFSKTMELKSTEDFPMLIIINPEGSNELNLTDTILQN